jgi:hypothetical protein
MATHPEDPRKPDDTKPAPHDSHIQMPKEPAAGDDLEPVVQGPGGSIEDSDSAIELGLPAGSADILSDSDLHPPVTDSSVNSGIAWAALMEEIPEPQADEIRIDAPSDVDLLRENKPAPAAPPAGPDATVVAPPAELSTFPPHRPGVHPPAPSGGEPFEQRDIFTAEPTGRHPRPDTHVGEAEQPPAAPSSIPPADPSRVELGEATPGQIKPGEAESSIIDLGAIDFPSEVRPSGVVEEAELVSESSGIDLSAEPSATGSGRDLIAEALESGIKFGPPPEPSDVGSAAVSGMHFAPPPEPSDVGSAALSPAESAIDFAHPKTAPEIQPPPANTPYASAIDPGAPPASAGPFSSAIEFGGPPGHRPGTSSAIEYGGANAPRQTPPPQRPGVQPPTGSAISSAIDYGGEPPLPQDSSSSVQLAPEGDEARPFNLRPPTLNPASGRPATEAATPAEMDAELRAGAEGFDPSDSEVDLGSRPSVSEFEGFEGLEPAKPVKTDSDSDIDINIGELPEGASASGSGLFVNANSGRLEPTDAAIDLDGEAQAEDGTEADAPAAAVIEEEPEEKPAKPKTAGRFAGLAGRARSPWVGGTAIGAVLGAAAMFLVQLLGGSSPAPKTPPPSAQAPPQPAPVAAPPAAAAPVAAAPAGSKFDLLRDGDLDKAAQAGIEQVDEKNPEQLGHRGEFRWLAYLQKQVRAGAALNPADAAVTQAAADLQAAADKGNADALFWLGHLQESTNALDKAKATYAKGATEAKDPLQKRRFQAALNRLELREAPAAGAARRPDAAAALLTALVALQAQAPAAAPAADNDEAGFGFWEASKLAHDGKFADAVKALDDARALHERRRFTRLRKAQNPLSDPTEEVFLRCADELKAYWQLEEQIHSGGYKSAADVIAKAKEGADAKAQADKIAKERDTAAAQVAKLQADEKALRDEATAQAAKAKEAADAAKAGLQAADDKAKAAQSQLNAATEREKQLAAGKAAAEGELKKLADELANAKLIDAKAGQKDLLQGVQSAIKLAATADSQGLVRGLQREVAGIRDQLAQRWRPGEMLTFWLPVLNDRSRRDLAGRAALDARRVADDASASPAEKARAEAVLGLALRNQGKPAEAKAALEKARAGLAPSDVEWRERVEAALKEVADPTTYYLARADELASRGQPAEAVAELEKAEVALPASANAFRARRALLQLDVARTKSAGRLAPNDPALAAARAAADEAARSGDAYALYVAGRIAEEAGDYDSAIAKYRKAVAAHPAQDAAGSRYRLALARVLLRAPAGSTPVGRTEPDAQPAETTGRGRPGVSDLVAALTTFLQAPPAAPAAQTEATQLADEVLASPSSTLEMRAQALAIKGMYTQALLTYADALRPALSRDQVETLKELILNHPALRRPESLAVPTPEEAERHYAVGLRLLYSGQYEPAEKELLTAVAQDSQDARYYYFLGLARLYQGKRDAFEDFEQGAKLEHQNLPSTEAVNSALERVQGPARRTIDNARGQVR